MTSEIESGEQVQVYSSPVTGEPVVVPYEDAYKASRPFRAHMKHLEGATWGEIAAEEGYVNARSAAADVAAWREHGQVLVADFNRKQALQLAYARYDALLRQAWQQAMGGSMVAIRTAADLVTRQLQALEILKDDESGGEGRTVVILDPAQAPELSRSSEK